MFFVHTTPQPAPAVVTVTEHIASETYFGMCRGSAAAAVLHGDARLLADFVGLADAHVSELEIRKAGGTLPILPALSTDAPQSWLRAGCVIAECAVQWEAFAGACIDDAVRLPILVQLEHCKVLLGRCLKGFDTFVGSSVPEVADGPILNHVGMIVGASVVSVVSSFPFQLPGNSDLRAKLSTDAQEALIRCDLYLSVGKFDDAMKGLYQFCADSLVLLGAQAPVRLASDLTRAMQLVALATHMQFSARDAAWFPLGFGDSERLTLAPAPLPPLEPRFLPEQVFHILDLSSYYAAAMDGPTPPVSALNDFVENARAELLGLLEQEANGVMTCSERPIRQDYLVSSWEAVDAWGRFAAMAIHVGQVWRQKWSRRDYKQSELRQPLGELGNIIVGWMYREIGETALAEEFANRTAIDHAKPERLLWEHVFDAILSDDVIDAVIHVGKFDGTDLQAQRAKVLETKRKNLLGDPDLVKALLPIRNEMFTLLDVLDAAADKAGTTAQVETAYCLHRALYRTACVLVDSNGAGARKDSLLKDDVAIPSLIVTA